MPFMVLPDKSIIDEQGKIIFFSLDRFRRDIFDGNCCFICGARPHTRDFNDEHVVPRWILKRFGLFDKTLTLPNGSRMQYGSMIVPCCAACNSYIGETFEIPISQSFARGYNGVTEFIRNGGYWRIFVWLNLLFFKFHYKDRMLREELDRRKPETRSIAECRYEPHYLHHIHCVARSGYTNAILDANIFGSVWSLPAYQDDSIEPFDYSDNYLSQSLIIRIGDCALVAILCDSCAVFSVTQDWLFKKVKGPLSPLQLREFYARASYLDLIIERRPVYFSTLSNEGYKISTEHSDKVRLQEYVAEDYGRFLFSACRDFLTSAPENIIENVKKGRRTFLLDENGNFNDAHMKRPLPFTDLTWKVKMLKDGSETTNLELFAAAQFIPLTDSPKLESPSFEMLPAGTGYKYVGSNNSNKYHYPTCRSAQKIKPENLVTFKSANEAKAAGYVPCKVCMPLAQD